MAVLEKDGPVNRRRLQASGYRCPLLKPDA
jgi:hypothetical protein